MNHGSRTHRKYAASAMSRNLRCTASPGACARAPRVEREAAKVGTRAHEVLEYCLRTGNDAAQGYIDVHKELEQANADAVQVCLDYVRDIVRQYGARDLSVYLEAGFDVIAGLVGGTSDIIIYIRSLKRLHVIDYKNGWEIVEVADDGYVNEQALTYGLGAIYALGSEFPIEDVVLSVAQPHPWHVDGPIRSFQIPAATVLEFRARIDRMVREAETNPVYRPSKSNCRWCDAKPFCPAVESQVVSMLGVNSLTEIRAETLQLASFEDLGRLSQLLATEEVVSAYFKSIRDVAVELAKNRNHIPGWKLVQTSSRREWYGNEQDIAKGIVEIAPNIDIKELFEVRLKSLTTVEKLVAKRVRATTSKRAEQTQRVADANHALAYLMDKKGSDRLALAPWDDNRMEVKVADVFGTVTLPQIEGPKA